MKKGGAFGRLFLSLCLALSLVPTAAWAGEDGTGGGTVDIPDDLDIVEGEIIVVYDDADDGDYHALSQQQVTSKLERAGMEVEEVLAEPTEDSGTIVLASTEGEVEDAIAAAEEVAGVDYAQPNFVYKLLEDEVEEVTEAEVEAVTNDPVTAVADAEEDENQYYLYGDELDTVGIKGADVIDAWDYADCSGSDIAIVIMDTGINLTHTDLADNILEEYCYDFYNDEELETGGSFNGDYYGHGSHVAGIAAAVADNATGIAGASYNAKLIAYKVFDDSTSDPSASTSTLVEAYGAMIDLVEEDGVNVRVVNLSLGSYGSDSSTEDRAWHSLIQEAYDLGVLTVCAGGNGSGNTPYTTNQYPSDWDECLAVTALDTDGTNAVWSDFNEEKDISAPGVSIYSTYNDGSSSYATVSGTSMASPLVAGIAALLFAANPDATVADVVEAIESTATEIDDSDDSYHRNSTGYGGVVSGSAGAINAEAAVLAITDAMITVPEDFSELYRTQTLQLGVSLDESSGEDVDALDWSWSVEDGTGSATIDEDGLLTAVTAGTVTVTVEATGTNTGRSFSASRSFSIQEIALDDEAGPWASTGYAEAVTVSWKAAVAATGYYVQRADAGSDDFTTIGHVTAAEGQESFSFEDETAESGCIYDYRILPCGTLAGREVAGEESATASGLRFDMISTMSSQTQVAERVGLLQDLAGDFSDTVFVVAEDDYPVAVAAAGLAGNEGAGFVTVGEEGLTDDVLAALELVDPYLVRVVCSEGAISDEVITEIEEALPRATVNSYSYSEPDDAGEGMYSLGRGNWGATAFVISGEAEDWEDALSVAAYAYAADAAVFTTNSSGRLSVTTRQNMLAGVFTDVIIVGDEDEVGTEVETQVENLGVDWVRISGETLYETSALLAANGTATGELDDELYCFAPADLATCLGAVSLAGYSGCPLLVVDEGAEDALDSFVVQGTEDSYTPIVYFDLSDAALSEDEKGRITDYVQGEELELELSTELSLRNASFGEIADQSYTGSAIEPAVTLSLDGVELEEGVDYTLEYADNVEVGTATVTATGIGDYGGSLSASFQIVAADISAGELSLAAEDAVYTGAAVEPAATLVLGGVELALGEDYTIEYADNVDAGTATATATGIGNYTGTIAAEFAIAAADLSDAAVSVEDEGLVYTGEAQEPGVAVTLGGEDLVEGEDYSLSYEDNVAAGTATVTATGIGNYAGTAGADFEIAAADIGEATFSEIASQTYTGAAIEPAVSLALGLTELVLGEDYTLSYADNVDAGTATVTATGIGNYTGTATTSFAIEAAELSGATVSEIAAQTYTGAALEPSPALTLDDGTALVEGEDFTVEYADNVDVGTATVTITGIGNYAGTLSASFEIAAAALSGASVALEYEGAVYTGEALEPAVSVTAADGTALVEGEDFTIAYRDNVEAGTATVTVTGIGNWAGELSSSFEIEAADISEALFSEIASQAYTGAAIEPEVSLALGLTELVEGEDYTLAYADNEDAGTATVTATGIGNYAGTVSASFAIEAAGLSGASVSAIEEQTYTGAAIEPAVSVTLSDGTALVEGEDYTVEYADNVEAGTATVTVTGIGNYAGTVSASFTIEAADLSGATVFLEPVSCEYTGAAIEPAVTVTLSDGAALVEGEDYTLTYSDNVEVGTAAVAVTGIGNYAGELTASFAIEAADLSDASISLESDSFTYTGSAIEPAVTVTLSDGTVLVEGTDYTVAYSDNTAVGTATVTISGSGNYTGTASSTFTIEASDLSGATVATEAESYGYTGSAIEPGVTVTAADGTVLVEGEDYTVEYADNTDVGTGTATITGIGNYSGTASVEFAIEAADLSGAVVSTESDSYDYTGEAIEATVTVSLNGEELVEGVDYTVAYGDNVEAGTASVTISGIGNYEGTASGSFTIEAAGLSDATLSLEADSCEYTGEAIEPAVTLTAADGTVLVEGEDYTVEYADNVEAGTASVTVTGIGNYEGSLSASFQITAPEAEEEEEEAWLFLDVMDESKYYYEPIYALVDLGYVTGYDDEYFGVGDDMTRGQFVTIIWRIAGEPEASGSASFSDVAEGVYYSEAVAWAAEEGVVDGYGDGRFGPTDSMSFEQMCLIVARYAIGGDAVLEASIGEAEAAEVLADFSDGDEVSSWAEKGMAFCVQEDLVEGEGDGSLQPDEIVARERVATVLWRAVEGDMI